MVAQYPPTRTHHGLVRWDSRQQERSTGSPPLTMTSAAIDHWFSQREGLRLHAHNPEHRHAA
jgi:hypothetical protein